MEWPPDRWHAGLVAGVWGLTPQEAVAAECDRRGREAVIRGCIDLLEGRAVDDALIIALAGPAAEFVLSGREGGRGGYWPRVWAARGLLHAWGPSAGPAIARATADESWRVREMAAKVVARHQVEDALTEVAAMLDDPVRRVRTAAERALIALSAARS
jgi:HEAT repeat protein